MVRQAYEPRMNRERGHAFWTRENSRCLLKRNLLRNDQGIVSRCPILWPPVLYSPLPWAPRFQCIFSPRMICCFGGFAAARACEVSRVSLPRNTQPHHSCGQSSSSSGPRRMASRMNGADGRANIKNISQPSGTYSLSRVSTRPLTSSSPISTSCPTRCAPSAAPSPAGSQAPPARRALQPHPCAGTPFASF